VNAIATEEERVMMLKVWWQRNRGWLLGLVVVFVVGFFGYKYYSGEQLKRAEQASLLFTDFFGAYEANDMERANTVAAQLQKDYKNTPYANSVALFFAQEAVDQNDLAKADEQLSWVIHNGAGFAKDIARARLAQVKLAQQQPDEALKLVNEISPGSYQPLYDDIKGDALVELKRYSEARTAYIAALEAYRALGFETHLLQFKADALPQG